MSNQFTDIIDQHLSDDNFIDHLSQQIGGAEREQTRAAANGIVAAMSSAMSKTASSENGANGLLSMLDANGDGSIIDDMMNMVSGGGGQTGAHAGLMENGGNIINSLLGGKQSGIIDMISKMSGLNGQKTGSLMSLLAPIILSALSKSGKQQGGGGFDIGGILNMLQGTQKKTSGNPAMDMIGQFLDKDGDGDITDDLLGGLGGGLLGGLFGGKK